MNETINYFKEMSLDFFYENYISDFKNRNLDFNYTKKNYYTTFSIPKKNKKTRKINKPNEELKVVQKMISIFLISKRNANYVSHGFELKKNIKSNAQKHVKKNLLLNIDLENFFYNIESNAVKKFIKTFLNIKETDELYLLYLDDIIELVTYKGFLPQGSPSSPVISNIVCENLDNDLEAFSKDNFLTYTRYADDMTFSTHKKNLSFEFSEIKKIIMKNGFLINDKKTRFQFKNQKQIVTGLIVNERVNVERVFEKKIRAILFNWMKYGYLIVSQKFYELNPERKFFEATLFGWIRFYGYNTEFGPKYKNFINNYMDLIILKNNNHG